jgi:hypothetical protein
MICKICGSKAEKRFDVKVIRKYDAEYFYCNECGFLFASNPFWLDEAYQSAINISDTGIMGRNIYFSKLVSLIIYFFFDKKGKFVDYAGGYGIFTRLMRDIGLDFYWQDPYCENLLARGFEYDSLSKEEINLITAFEVFEHLVDPLDEIDKMLKISNNIVFSTVLLPSQIPAPGEWWYYGLDHGQHVSFYSEKTIKVISKHFNLNLYSFGDIFVFTKKELSSFVLSLIQFLFHFGLFSVVSFKIKSKTDSDFRLLKSKS